MPSSISATLRQTACAEHACRTLSPAARRLAIENGSDAPARNENAG